MTWHNVSDREPPKEGSPWVMLMRTRDSHSAKRVRWRDGWWVTKTGARWSLDSGIADCYWALAPGQAQGAEELPTFEEAARMPAHSQDPEAVHAIREVIVDKVRPVELRNRIRELEADLATTSKALRLIFETNDERHDLRLVRTMASVALDQIRNAPGQETGEPGGETVEVRIAVLVDDKGCWYGVGWDGASDSEVRGTALDCSECNESETLSFVTARIPLPKPLEIQGEVERG